MSRRLTRNVAQCAYCGDVIESKHRHDWQACKCGAIYIDGGLSYQRGGGDLSKFIDLAEYEEDE